MNSCPSLQRLQLDMVLNSLQEQSHVASLLGYSSPGELSAGLALPPTPDRPTGSVSSNSEAPDHLHLAEVLLKTLLLSIGFYTVSLLNILKITQRMLISFYLPPKMFRIMKLANYMLMLFLQTRYCADSGFNNVISAMSAAISLTF